MSKLSFIFNETDFKPWLDIDASFIMPFSPSQVDTSVKVGHSNGQMFIDSTDDLTTIDIPFIISGGDVKAKFDQVRQALHVFTPKQLIISDKPDRYWLAKPKGGPTVKRDDEVYITGTISFECTFPYAQSFTQTEYTFKSGQQIQINNEGTEPTTANFDIVNASDNGFIGIAGTNGTIQLGNTNESDSAPTYSTNVALDNTFNNASELSGWTLNSTTFKPAYPNNKVIAGSFAVKRGEAGDYCIGVSNYANGSVNGMWYGPSVYHSVTSAKDFEITTYIKNVDYNHNSLGVSEFNVYSSDGSIICGYRFRQISRGGQMELYFYVGNTVFQQWTGSTDAFLKNFLGNVVIKKEGNAFTFSVINNKNGVHGIYHFNSSTYGAKSISGVGYWVAKSQAYEGFISELYWVYVKTTSQGFTDVKNIFGAGDQVHIEETDRTVTTYLNGMPRIDLQDIGTRPIIVPPGLSYVEVLVSDFSSPASITMSFNRRYI